MSPHDALTRLLSKAETGGDEVLDEILPLVYDELHALARARMRSERDDHTLQPTALVHEAYLRLCGDEPAAWDGRAHFFGAAALAMRRILVEHARARGAAKRGAGQVPVTLTDAIDLADGAAMAEIVAVDEVLDRLAAFDARKARVVELRFFGGLDVAETAAVLGVSDRTVERDWGFARAWLFRELNGP